MPALCQGDVLHAAWCVAVRGHPLCCYAGRAAACVPRHRRHCADRGDIPRLSPAALIGSALSPLASRSEGRQEAAACPCKSCVSSHGRAQQQRRGRCAAQRPNSDQASDGPVGLARCAALSAAAAALLLLSSAPAALPASGREPAVGCAFTLLLGKAVQHACLPTHFWRSR
jgi:hypothetical protein